MRVVGARGLGVSWSGNATLAGGADAKLMFFHPVLEPPIIMAKEQG
ncbi:MAG: hypothetical protein Q8O40_15635 [Chloroflexota bacterium]|nr:hypothetical protein [Chloroflexota bacterium]